MRDDPSPIDQASNPLLSLVAYMDSGRDGSSVADDLAAFCAGRGYRLVETVIEPPCKTARPFDERPGGQEALRLIRVGRAQGILVSELDQAFSSVSDAVSTLERWSEERVAFVCVNFARGGELILNGNNGAKADLVDVFAGLGQFHRRMVARKVQAQLETKRLRGEWLGRVPYGFVVVEGRLAEDPVQMKRIVEMKRAHRRGKSYREIAARFGVSVATAHRLVNTDLRLLKRGRVAPRKGSPGALQPTTDRSDRPAL